MHELRGMKVARERAAIERTLREEQDANDSGFKSARHSQATTEGRRGGQLRPPSLSYRNCTTVCVSSRTTTGPSRTLYTLGKTKSPESHPAVVYTGHTVVTRVCE